MTKQDVVNRTAGLTGLDPAISREIIETFFEVVKSSLTDGEPIYIRTFGSFGLKRRAEKKARNITQNTSMLLAAHVVPIFKASAEFRDQVRARALPAEQEKSAY